MRCGWLIEGDGNVVFSRADVLEHKRRTVGVGVVSAAGWPHLEETRIIKIQLNPGIVLGPACHFDRHGSRAMVDPPEVSGGRIDLELRTVTHLVPLRGPASRRNRTKGASRRERRRTRTPLWNRWWSWPRSPGRRLVVSQLQFRRDQRRTVMKSWPETVDPAPKSTVRVFPLTGRTADERRRAIAALVPQNVDQLLGQVMHLIIAVRIGDGLRERAPEPLLREIVRVTSNSSLLPASAGPVPRARGRRWFRPV